MFKIKYQLNYSENSKYKFEIDFLIAIKTIPQQNN